MQHKRSEIFDGILRFIYDYKDARGGRTPSVREIADALGIHASTVSRYLADMRERGMIEADGQRNIITPRDMSGSGAVCRVPVLGRVSCGIARYAEENIEEYVKLPVSLLGRGEYFILRASGDSMTGAGIDDGDLVLVRRQDTADYNRIVVALIDDEATLKRFRPQSDCVYLHPENPAYDEIIVESCIIQGVAVKVLKDLV